MGNATVNLERLAARFDGQDRATLFKQATGSLSNGNGRDWFLTKTMLFKAIEKASDPDPAVVPEAMSLAILILTEKPELGQKNTCGKIERLLAIFRKTGKLDPKLLGDVRAGVGFPKEEKAGVAAMEEARGFPFPVKTSAPAAVLKQDVVVEEPKPEPVAEKPKPSVMNPVVKAETPKKHAPVVEKPPEIDAQTKNGIDAAIGAVKDNGIRANQEINAILNAVERQPGTSCYALGKSLEGLLGVSKDKDSFGWLVMRISGLNGAASPDNFNAAVRGFAHGDETARHYSVLAVSKMLKNNFHLATREALEKAVLLFSDSSQLVQNGARSLARLLEADLAKKGERITIPQIIEERKPPLTIVVKAVGKTSQPVRLDVQRILANAAGKARGTQI